MTIARIVAAFFVGLVAIVVVNFYFDPGARVTIDNVNLAGVRDPNIAWEVKPFLVRKYSHDAIMIGSSRIFYVDPTKVPGFRFYDAGQAYMTPQRLKLYLERVACNLKLVVIGYDFDMFFKRLDVDPIADPSGRKPDPLADPYNKPLLRAFPQPCIGPSLFQRVTAAADAFGSNLSYLVSSDTFGKSVSRAVAVTADARLVIHPAGNLDLTDALNFQSQRQPDPYQVAEPTFRQHLEECCSFASLAKLTYSRDWLADVKATHDLLAARHTRAVVIITPIHERVLARYVATGHADELALFRNDICDIFPQAVDLTESTYSGYRRFFAFDPLHFLPDTGVEMIDAAIQGRLPSCASLRTGNR